MSLRAHLAIFVLAVLTLVFILRLVRRHRLRAKYSVLWISLGAALAIVAAAPRLLEGISDLVGIRTPVFTFLLMAITFLLILALHFSWELSRLEDRTPAPATAPRHTGWASTIIPSATNGAPRRAAVRSAQSSARAPASRTRARAP